MKFIQAKQGTPEWLAARCGIPTASRFADAISVIGGLDERQAKYVAAIRGGASQAAACATAGYKAAPTADSVRRAIAGEVIERPSDIAIRYADDLAIERISGKPYGIPAKTWLLDRGHELEDAARFRYQARSLGSMVTEAGLCITEDGPFGYSTDGLVGDEGLIEIKAPIDSTKIRIMWETQDVSEYMHQMQGGMWITGRRWCDFIMYAPDLEACGADMFIKRIYRDDDFIDAMVLRLRRFAEMVDHAEALFRRLGKGGAPAALAPAAAPATPAAKTEAAPDWRAEFTQA